MRRMVARLTEGMGHAAGHGHVNAWHSSVTVTSHDMQGRALNSDMLLCMKAPMPTDDSAMLLMLAS